MQTLYSRCGFYSVFIIMYASCGNDYYTRTCICESLVTCSGHATTHSPLLENSCIHPGPDYCYDYRVFKLLSSGSNVPTYHLCLGVDRLQSLMAVSTMEEDLLLLVMISTLSTAMTHHKTSGPLYHHFLSHGLVWVKSMVS